MTSGNHTPNTAARPLCDRRTFLVGTAATAAGALLAACGGKSDELPTIDASEVPVGSAVIVGDYIVAQPEEGVFHAYSAKCPHQGAKVSVVDGATVACPAHGSVFDISDGSPVAGPSRAPLRAANLSNKGSTLSIS